MRISSLNDTLRRSNVCVAIVRNAYWCNIMCKRSDRAWINEWEEHETPSIFGRISAPAEWWGRGKYTKLKVSTRCACSAWYFKIWQTTLLERCLQRKDWREKPHRKFRQSPVAGWAARRWRKSKVWCMICCKIIDSSEISNVAWNLESAPRDNAGYTTNTGRPSGSQKNLSSNQCNGLAAS